MGFNGVVGKPLAQSDFPLRIVEDYGQVRGQTYRKALFECNVCKEHVEMYVSNAKKGNGTCHKCSRLKPLKDLPLVVIEDLGIQYPTELSTKPTRMCIVECPKCSEHFRTTATDIRQEKVTQCRRCSYEDSGWSYTNWVKKAEGSKHFIGYTLYIVKLTGKGEEFYKVGKTFTSVAKRFQRGKGIPYTVDVVKTFTFEDGIQVCELERFLINSFTEGKYKPKNWFEGHTECVKDIHLEEVELMINKFNKEYTNGVYQS
jgi:hypothetical protein